MNEQDWLTVKVRGLAALIKAMETRERAGTLPNDLQTAWNAFSFDGASEAAPAVHAGVQDDESIVAALKAAGFHIEYTAAKAEYRVTGWLPNARQLFAALSASTEAAAGEPVKPHGYLTPDGEYFEAKNLRGAWPGALALYTAPQAASGQKLTGEPVAAVKVSAQGVQFGNAWYSHERITGYSSEQLNAGDCHVTGRAYMQWVRLALTAPPAASGQKLTDEQILAIADDHCITTSDAQILKFVRALSDSATASDKEGA